MRVVHVLSGMALACICSSSLACDLPKLVVIPDADKVTGHEKEIRTEVEKYFAAMKTYVACVQSELKADGGDNAPALVKSLLINRNNVAVAEANAVVGWYKQNVPTEPEKGKGDQGHEKE